MNSYIYDLIISHDVKIVGWENDSICIKNKYGGKRWFKNGQLHREDGPAVEYSNGYKRWYKNGQWEFNNR